MEFEPFQYTDAAAGAIQDLLLSEDGKKLPEDVQKKAWEFIRPGGSINFAVAAFAELIFARKEDIKSGAALQLAASCARTANLHNIDMLGGKRGVAIMQALRRRSGEKAPEGAKWPKAEADPRPRLQYMSEDEQLKAAKEAPEDAPTEVQVGPVTQPLLMAEHEPEE